MALWDLDQIKAYVRILTQKKGAAYSDTDLGNDINRYYYYKFPLEVQPGELLDWYEFNTVASTDTYAINDDEATVIQAPLYVNNIKARVWLDPESFYDRFPQNSTYDEQRPQHALIYGGNIVFRHPPDAIYPVKIQSVLRPTTLTAGTQTPTREEWGPIIAYGTAIEKLTASRDLDGANTLREMYEEHKSTAQVRTGQQLFSGRVVGRY